jgi:allantoicase
VPILPENVDAHVAKTINFACSALGSRVVGCSDDYFSSVSKLLLLNPPVVVRKQDAHDTAEPDGWETATDNPAEYDWVVIRLGVRSAVVHGVEIDTRSFEQHHAEQVMVEGACPETRARMRMRTKMNKDRTGIPRLATHYTHPKLHPTGPACMETQPSHSTSHSYPG